MKNSFPSVLFMKLGATLFFPVLTSLAYRFAPENRSGIVVLNVPGNFKISTQRLKERQVIVPVNGGLQPDRGNPSSDYSIRMGMHYYNNKDDIDKIFAAIEDCCRE